MPIFAHTQTKINIAVVGFFMPSENEIKEASKSEKNKVLWSDYYKITKTVRTMEGYVVEAFVSDQRFTVVERQRLNIVEGERELQKSEDFIDGYVVQEGKNIGADYLVLGDFDPINMVLSLSLFSVADQKTVDKKNVNLEPVLKENKSPRTLILPATQEMLFRQFPPKILVIKELDGSSKKVKLALVSGGSKYGLKKEQILEVKIKVSEEVDGEKLERLETIAQLVIIDIENENFSKCEVIEGGDKLKTHITSGGKLYCFPKL